MRSLRDSAWIWTPSPTSSPTPGAAVWRRATSPPELHTGQIARVGGLLHRKDEALAAELANAAGAPMPILFDVADQALVKMGYQRR
jgi:hypothetical protein